MTEKIFTASTDIRIKHGEGQFIEKSSPLVGGFAPLPRYMEGSAVDAAMAEFYQYRRDDENGVYRSKKHPNVTVRVVGAGGNATQMETADPTDPRAHFRAYDESNGRMTAPLRRNTIEHRLSSPNIIQAERRYLFEAMEEFLKLHPLPKPAWHDARPGQVWMVRTKSGTKAPLTVKYGIKGIVFEGLRANGTPHSMLVTDESITSAQRYVPFEDEES